MEYDIWEKEEDLENAKKVIAKFKRKMNVEGREQEKLDMVEERDFRRGELLGNYITKILYRWDNGKFEKEYLRKLKRNW